MIKKLLCLLVISAFALPAFADVTVSLINDSCQIYGGNYPAGLKATWQYPVFGTPACVLGSTFWGSVCNNGLTLIWVTKNIILPHGMCTLHQDWKAAYTVSISPACGGTILTPEFILMSSYVD